MAAPHTETLPGAAGHVIDDEAHLRKSSSSAMPPDSSDEIVPKLKAKVHQRLGAPQCAAIPLSSVRYRPLGSADHEEMIALHTEWFPVTYDAGFYDKSVKGEIFTLAATHREPNAIDENVLGIITMSTCPEHYGEDLAHVLGSRAEDLPPNQHASGDQGVLAYILTLGVIDNFRRRGAAREMLKQSIAYVDENRPNVQAIYLHVVTYNDPAIQLYESLKFLRIAHFTSMYNLHGKPYDSYLYALYLHGARPPWKWRLKSFFGSTWKDWVFSVFGSLRFWSSPDDIVSEPQHLTHEQP